MNPEPGDRPAEGRPPAPGPIAPSAPSASEPAPGAGTPAAGPGPTAVADPVQLEPDLANDDPHAADEINLPIGNGNKLYSVDAPGIFFAAGIASTAFYQHMNALEFVRTKFGAGATFAHPTGAAPEGSRSSELDAWHNWVYAEKLGGGWIRPVTPTNAIDPAFNEIALGLKAMNGNLAPA